MWLWRLALNRVVKALFFINGGALFVLYVDRASFYDRACAGYMGIGGVVFLRIHLYTYIGKLIMIINLYRQVVKSFDLSEKGE